jgi:hypothetical protein
MTMREISSPHVSPPAFVMSGFEIPPVRLAAFRLIEAGLELKPGIESPCYTLIRIDIFLF